MKAAPGGGGFEALWDGARGYQRVILRDVVVEVRLGLHPWERHPERPQRIIVNVELFAHQDTPFTGKGVDAVLDYDAIRAELRGWPKRDHTDLIETLLEELIAVCFRDARVEACRVPTPAVEPARRVGPVAQPSQLEELQRPEIVPGHGFVFRVPVAPIGHGARPLGTRDAYRRSTSTVLGRRQFAPRRSRMAGHAVCESHPVAASTRLRQRALAPEGGRLLARKSKSRRRP